jgi:hypothetical protein
MAATMDAAPASSDSLIRRIRTGIGRGADLSIAVVIESARLAMIVAPLAFSLPQSAHANSIETIDYEWVEENASPPPRDGHNGYGPFRVIDPVTAELNGETDAATPAQFRALLAAHPGIKLIRMVECAGTVDDGANLETARLIRKAGIATHVPANGSVRSGGVELFLAGVQRTYDKGAEFGVHSWEDEDGLQARDFGNADPMRADYVRFYQDIGLPADKALAFYAFTNQTPFEQVHYMTEGEIAQFGLAR